MSLRRIIKDLRILADDCLHLEDDAPLPQKGAFTVSLTRWRKERESLLARAADAGVRLPNDVDVNEIAGELAGDLARLARIALEFPKFGDGRAFSQARVLREQHGFKGEIRAVGDVLRDQLWYMHRCGFDAFELRPDRLLEDALKAFTEMTVTYQPATDTPESIFLRRRPIG
jgi:uncharacterized protein (DUF934 family)